MQINADFHIHSRYSGGVSQKMTFPVLSKHGKEKGIDLLGTGDCLHPNWRKEIQDLTKVDDSIYEKEDMNFILTTEVETDDRVHHLLIFPSISKVEEFYERIEKFSKNLDSDGRPRLSISGEEIALIAEESGTLFGPSHAFTPYTGIYGNHDNLKSAYGNLSKNISFLELGLSADSSYADKISELHDIVYLSNSDAHSPFPHRLAREFNVIDIPDVSFDSIKNLFEMKKGKIIENIGLPPEEGKYNESACNKCYTHYSFEESISKNWRCSCGGTIKKGVADRVEELSDIDARPEHRPPYLALIPLQEIIAKAIGHSSTNTKKVNQIWRETIEEFGDEVEVLRNANLESIVKIAGEKIAELVKKFRKDDIKIQPGGGGKYGKIVDEVEKSKQKDQKSLMDF